MLSKLEAINAVQAEISRAGLPVKDTTYGPRPEGIEYVITNLDTEFTVRDTAGAIGRGAIRAGVKAVNLHYEQVPPAETEEEGKYPIHIITVYPAPAHRAMQGNRNVNGEVKTKG